MKFVVRSVDLTSDREDLIKVQARNLPEIDHRRRFEWLYRRNPAGEGLAWFAGLKDSGKIIGVASVFPTTLWIGENKKTCGQVGDFAVDSGYRSLGPAMALQRATFEPVDCGKLALCYDCPPHEAGMAPFRRMGMKASAHVHRYVRLVRTGPWLARRIGVAESLVAPFAAVVDRLMAMWPKPKDKGVEIESYPGAFGEEFTELDRRVGGRERVIRSRRNAEDLNWRYRSDPLRTYEVLTARRDGELVGFLICAASQRGGEVVDLFSADMSGTSLPLLESAASTFRRNGLESLQASVTDKEVGGRFLRQARFHSRESVGRLVPYAAEGEVKAFLEHGPRWAFTRTDLMS